MVSLVSTKANYKDLRPITTKSPCSDALSMHGVTGSMWRQYVETVRSCLVRSRSGAPKFGAQCVAASIWGCIGVMGLRSL
jgi:hypothetical protein